MNLKNKIIAIGLFVTTVLLGSYITSCTSQSYKKMVVFTRVPVNKTDIGKDLPHLFTGAGLSAISQSGTNNEAVNLTPDFYSACSPHVSYDAQHLLFLGQKEENDLWQVWEMDLKSKTSRQITNCKMSCNSVCYLPGNRIAFSKEMKDKKRGINSNTLFAMNFDGTNLEQITFHPHDDFISTVLKEGRILINSRQVFPKKGKTKLLAMRPNGTKAELFYSDDSSTVYGQCVTEQNGLIYLTEQNQDTNSKVDIVSVSYNRPLHSKINYTSGIPGNFYWVLPLSAEKMIVSYRSPDSKNIGLWNFSLTEKSISEPLYNNAEFNCFEPVLIQPYNRPRKLPNDMNKAQSSGSLLCTNINLTGTKTTNATKIELLGLEKSLGIIEMEKDGSVYLSVVADTPVRIQTLDADNNIVSGPSEWIWVRPFERRGCIGCHENHELVPQNTVPMAINKWPVVVPVDSTQQNKKSEITKVSEMK